MFNKVVHRNESSRFFLQNSKYVHRVHVYVHVHILYSVLLFTVKSDHRHFLKNIFHDRRKQ